MPPRSEAAPGRPPDVHNTDTLRAAASAARKHHEGNLISQEGVWHRFFFSFFPPPPPFSLVMVLPAWHGTARLTLVKPQQRHPGLSRLHFRGFGGDQRGKKIQFGSTPSLCAHPPSLLALPSAGLFIGSLSHHRLTVAFIGV